MCRLAWLYTGSKGLTLGSSRLRKVNTKTCVNCNFEASYPRYTMFTSFIFIFFAAGYNNVEVAEFLLENGADVNVQDKGGLIPLHNASSYGVSGKFVKSKP
jgi:tankyrase